MADYQFLNQQGLIVPDTSALRAQVVADFRAAFGDDIDTDPAGPIGLLITLHTEMRDAVARNNAELANQLNPDIATGVFLDAIFGLTDAIGRKPAVKSVIYGAVLTGDPSTVVSAGTLAAALDGSQWELAQEVTIGQNGTAAGDFVAVEFGPIECDPGHLQTLVTGTLGVMAVNNPTAAVVGRSAESDVQLRRRRRQTLAIQAAGTPEAIRSRLMAIEDVKSIAFLENTSSEQQTIEGITMKPHSIWVCAEGGSDHDIAEAIFNSKDAGTGTNGAQTVNITDPIVNKEYPISFDRPEAVNLIVKVTVRQSTLDAENVIPQLVENYVNGLLEGDVSFVVGADVSPWEIAGAINQQEPRLNVVKVELTKSGTGSWSPDVYSININQVARVSINSVQVSVV